MPLNKSTEKIPSNNLFVITLLIILVAVGVTVLVSKSLIDTIILDGKVVTKKNEAVKVLKANNEAAPELVKGYLALGSNAELLKSALPATSDFPSIISSLEYQGQLTGVLVRSVSPTATASASVPVASTEATAEGGASASAGASAVAPAANVPKWQTFTFDIDVEGSYETIGKFIKTVETSARPLRVIDVKFTGSGKKLSAKVNMETYYQGMAELPFSMETVK